MSEMGQHAISNVQVAQNKPPAGGSQF